MLHIRVRQSLVEIANPPPSTVEPSRHIYLIEGPIDDIRQYAGTTVDWVIKVAHLICDPTGAGQIYTHTTGMPLDWYSRNRDAVNWRQVVPGDPLLPGIYEFETTGPITLSKISERQSHSVTSAGSESSADTFRRHIERRDRTCVVTGARGSFIASHLIPKRIGTQGVKEVAERFVGAQAAHGIHRFHPEVGVLLYGTLDNLVEQYKLGFYHVAGQRYTLHNFDADRPDLPVNGEFLDVLAAFAVPPLHLYPVTLSVHGGGDALPLKGVFNWHYLQCVVQRFGTRQYKNLTGITFHVVPFKTAGDESEDEFEDDVDAEPPYPTYRFDRFMAEQWKKHQEQERFKEVAQWSSEVISDVEGGSAV